MRELFSRYRIATRIVVSIALGAIFFGTLLNSWTMTADGQPARQPTRTAKKATGPDVDIDEVYKQAETVKAADGDDDFEIFRKESQRHASRQALIKEQQRAEQELAELRAAEAKAEAERERQEQEIARQNLRQRQEQTRRRAEQTHKFRKQIKGDVDKLEGVTNRDLYWNGIE